MRAKLRLGDQVGFTIFPKEPLLEMFEKKLLKIHRTERVVKTPLYLVRRQGQALSNRVLAAYQLIRETAATYSGW